MKPPKRTETLTHLLSLALRLEGEGQYNVAKIARAQADSISRRAAWELNLPSDREILASDIEHVAASLDDADLHNAFRVAASTLTSGRAPLNWDLS
jgi:Tfp pilus assembly protein PilN